jgi:hypothetical protein
MVIKAHLMTGKSVRMPHIVSSIMGDCHVAKSDTKNNDQAD